jgi:hypothetical protein
MTATCTHNQCDLTNYGSFSASGISCPDGLIAIDTATDVDAAVRTAVPD